MHWQAGLQAFDCDDASDAIGVRVKQVPVTSVYYAQCKLPVEHPTDRRTVTGLNDVWQRVASFHPCVARVDSGNTSHRRWWSDTRLWKFKCDCRDDSQRSGKREYCSSDQGPLILFRV